MMRNRLLRLAAPTAVAIAALAYALYERGPGASPVGARSTPTGETQLTPQASLEDHVPFAPRTAAASASAAATATATPAPAATPVRTQSLEIARGSSLGQVLQDLGLLAPSRAALMSAMKPTLDPTRISTGTKVEATYRGPESTTPSEVAISLDALHSLVARRTDTNAWQTTVVAKPTTQRQVAYAGVVASNLWSSATAAGMDPQLITQLADVFAWQVDFHREVHTGDRWRLTVELTQVDGQPVGDGEIIAAEYQSGDNLYRAVRHLDHHVARYYAPDGSSLKSMFLRSPLRFGHITSRFSKARFHPILKIVRPHHGIDYGAPTGTPIMTVGDGVVLFAGRRGGAGKMVAIRHNSRYETQYKHMSGFAPGIKRGAKVHMGQVIGYVGMTGLATGPHVHFEFHVDGRYVDPLGLKFPAAPSLTGAALVAFQGEATHALADLPPWSHEVLTQHGRHHGRLAIDE